ncbi:MAG: phage holin family protein [Defluviitaleaceae bacterium]|nr:phage holin family protein [Defluviitaleaceae bacterium]
MAVDFIEILINAILAAFGGVVRRMSEMERQEGKKATFAYYMIGSFISMFVGIVVYFLCKNFEVTPFLTAGLTALSGYMGSPVLDLLSEIINKRMKSGISHE